ncbi:GPO family capsid scaffolding protein [Shewanella sp.]|uniref:GPO family capsid scaffolding protein n=1 Tax=Gammaproteobacteria TaxID=1236 RepID=UPI001B703062|nr:GPO family capsid scaffolding protein [Shewanella sp.]MBP6518332.1 GPO family capsid scaffolding protein [Shewanella sp.]
MSKDNKTLQVIVCTEGGTLNGFAVTRDQIKQMADNYSTQLYAARINLEHITSIYPDSQWRHFSMVDSVRAIELEDGPLKGKLALEITATIDPIKDAGLVALNQSGQKIFSSIEFLPDCPNDAAKGAYLTGVALTDTPAAFGTQVIKLSNRERGLPVDANNTYTASLETMVKLTAAAIQEKNDQLTLSDQFVAGIKKILGIQKEAGSQEVAALREGISLTADTCAKALKEVEALKAENETQASDINKLTQELEALKSQLTNTDAGGEQRQLSTGNGGFVQSEY